MAMHLKWKCEQGAALAATIDFGALLPCGGGRRGRRQLIPAGNLRRFRARSLAPPSYLRNDVIFYDAGIGPRPINGGLDPGFDQDLWMDRLTLGGFHGQWILWRKIRHRGADPYVFDLTVAQNPGGPAVRFIRVAARSGFR